MKSNLKAAGIAAIILSALAASMWLICELEVYGAIILIAISVALLAFCIFIIARSYFE